MPCFYAANLTKQSKLIEISASEHHHITRVFRFTEGKEIFLNSGKGVYAKALIKEISKKHLTCQILDFIPKEKYQPDIALAFSLLRNKNDHLLVEKLTELGVAELFPFESDYSVRKASNNTIEKFNISAIEAIKQCDNGYLPLINKVKKLKNQIEEIQNKGYEILIASEKEKEISLKDIVTKENLKPICILIGPEGGFSQEEFDYFAEKNFKQYKLGLNILRAETAGICAVSQVINILL
jgi:16S rRNA (uracil1498-N3)-methyltransferase